jgi:hypothetical protein
MSALKIKSQQLEADSEGFAELLATIAHDGAHTVTVTGRVDYRHSVAMLALLARGVRVLSRDGRCLTAREVSPDVALRYGAWERMSELRHTVRRLKVKETRRGELQQSWREISAAVRACSPDARARVLQTIA